MMLSLLAAATAIDPQYARNYTVYHVNPHKYGAIPVNMDIGDSYGDMFFDLHNVLITPLECPNGAASGHGCSNPEASGPDLVVNKLTIEMDSRFSTYAKCNIGVNGTDGHGNVCADDTYCCFCAGSGGGGGGGGGYVCYDKKCYESHHGTQTQSQCESTCNKTTGLDTMSFQKAMQPPHGHNVPCNATVGKENVLDYFGGQHASSCSTGSPDYDCFRGNAAKKYTSDNPGYWYSPQDIGYCNDHPGSATNCTWRVVSVDKIVTKDCHNDKFFSGVEQTSPSCFSACGGSRNTSSPCWIRCFYEAALGPDSGKAGGAVAGIPLDTLVGFWTDAFKDESEGGCPSTKQYGS